MDTMRVERSGDGLVAEVVLVGPPGNPLGRVFWDELPGVFPALDVDPDVRVVLLRAEGRNFCTGLDLREAGDLLAPAGGPAADRLAFLRWLRRLQRSITAIEECAKPVVAAVQGWCIGGGIDLITAADIRLASADARFSVREVRMGVVSDAGALHRLPGIVGEARARHLLLTGEDFDVQRAERWGLVTGVYPDPEALLDAARTTCRDLAGLPPTAVQGTKFMLNAGREQSVRDGLDHVAAWNTGLLATDDLTEAMTAARERRPPRYRGH
jgi:enoyl-CoA hydratase